MALPFNVLVNKASWLNRLISVGFLFILFESREAVLRLVPVGTLIGLGICWLFACVVLWKMQQASS